MPISDFRWMTPEECERMTTAFSTYNTDGDHGLWLCVDLSYPDHLHERHNEFPLAPESRKVGWHELSPRQQQLFAMQWAKSRDDPTLAKKFHAMSASKRAEMLTLIQSRNVNPDGDDRSRDYVPPSDEQPVKWDQLSKRQQLLLSLHLGKSPEDLSVRTKFEAQPAKLLATLCDKRAYCVHIKVKICCSCLRLKFYVCIMPTNCE